MNHYQKYLKYKNKYQVAGMQTKQPLFNIKGPLGTRGQIFFSKENHDSVIKKGLKKKDCKAILEEVRNYNDIFECISKLRLTSIRTIKSKKYDKCSFIAQRLYPLELDDKNVQLDYSYLTEGGDTNTWKTYSPEFLAENDILNEEQLFNIIPYELGCLWITMIIKKQKVIWEPELMMAKLYNEDQYSLFIIDFDKVYPLDKDNKYYSLGQPIHNYLTNVFPSPSSKYFDRFAEGITNTSERFGYKNLGIKVIDNLKSIKK